MPTVSGYQNWVASNTEVIRNALYVFTESKKRELIIKLRGVADTMLRYIEGSFLPIPGGNDQFPVYSGNLRDATGIAIYVDGRTEYLVIPPKVAKRKQHTGPELGNRRDIDGHQFLQLSIIEGASKFTSGIWLVLYSAVPYADKINATGSKWGRGVDFFTKTKEELTTLILSKIGSTAPMYSFSI